MKRHMVSLMIVFAVSTLAVAPMVVGSTIRPVVSPVGDAYRTVSMTVHAVETPIPEDDFQSSPVMFIENVGQWDASARFQVWGGPTETMWLGDDATWITLFETGPEKIGRITDRTMEHKLRSWPDDRESSTPKLGINIKLSFVGANPHPRIETNDRLNTTASYFLGDDPSQWRSDVPIWGSVRYIDLYPGVDLELASEAGKLVPRLVTTRAEADLNVVRLRVEGADAAAMNGHVLRLNTALREHTVPLLQVDKAQVARPQVESRGTRIFDVVAPFFMARSNHRSIIENQWFPVDNPADLLYSTFLGGSSGELGLAIAVDGVGSAFVTGHTNSGDFPTSPGSFDPSYNSSYDAFVVKLNPTGSGLAYVIFLGGSHWDGANDIAVDEAGSAYITGSTYSSDFPTTPGAFDPIYNDGNPNVFVAKLNSSGSMLSYTTFIGNGGEIGWSIAVDGEGSATVAGDTGSSNFPTTPGAYDTSYNGGTDTFLARLNPTGSGLIYATYLGGGSDDMSRAVAVDMAGSAYVAGSTDSSDFPTTPGALSTTFSGGLCGVPPTWICSDAFVVKLPPAGSGLVYATFLGGTGGDRTSGIAVDSEGSAYLTGGTDSSDFPTTSGAFDTSYNGITDDDAFVAKLNPAGSELTYATYVGGSDNEGGTDIAVDGIGSAHVTGETWSSNFPTTSGAFDTSRNGVWDAFMAKLNPAGSALAYATFLGGNDVNSGSAIAVDGVSNAYVTGFTYSDDFPTTPGAFDTTFNGSQGDSDAFVAKLKTLAYDWFYFPIICINCDRMAAK